MHSVCVLSFSWLVIHSGKQQCHKAITSLQPEACVCAWVCACACVCAHMCVRADAHIFPSKVDDVSSAVHVCLCASFMTCHPLKELSALL